MKLDFLNTQIRLVVENLQLADKLYFKTGKLDESEKAFILNITNGDNFTKIICDILLEMKSYEWGHQEYLKDLEPIYKQLKEYNKNIFPIKDFDIYNSKNINDLHWSFKHRQKLLNNIKKMPSIAIRNLKNDIRIPRDGYELKTYNELLEYFIGQISLLSNRGDEMSLKIFKKMFKSGATLKQMADFADDKYNLLGGNDFTKEKIHDIVDDNKHYELDIIYEKDDIMVIDVTGPNGIKEIGCNSLWCFTYGTGFDLAYRQWNNYSTDDHVYVIVDFSKNSDESEFMYVLIRPLKPKYTEKDEENEHLPLFDMSNEPVLGPIGVLKDLVGANNLKKLFKFD